MNVDHHECDKFARQRRFFHHLSVQVSWEGVYLLHNSGNTVFNIKASIESSLSGTTKIVA
jgi:hypothetical protein